MFWCTKLHCRCQFHQGLLTHFSYKILTPKPERNYKKLLKWCLYEKFTLKNVDEIDYRCWRKIAVESEKLGHFENVSVLYLNCPAFLNHVLIFCLKFYIEKDGDSAMLKNCFWKNRPIPCSKIFIKVSATNKKVWFINYDIGSVCQTY